MKTLDDSLLQTVTRRLVAEFQPDQIWLYGSHAWGDPHDDSDVDILVVVPQSNESPIQRSQRAHRCLRGLRMPKDVLVETRQEVDRVKELQTSLESDILNRGRLLMADLAADEAKAWMVKAWRDLETAQRAAGGVPPFYDIAVYHCQQTAEKAVKAFLVSRSKPYQKTHDIEVLVDLASDIDPCFATLADAADALTPYATRFRYPNATFAVEPQPKEYNEALEHARAVYNFVLNLLPPHARP